APQMTTFRPTRSSNLTGDRFEGGREEVLVPAPREDALALIVRRRQLLDLGSSEERVVNPVVVAPQEIDRDAALVGLADALERFHEPVRAEQLEKARDLTLVSEQVMAAEDLEKRVAREEG